MTEALLGLTADIVSAHVGHNVVATGDLPGLIRNVHQTLTDITAARPEPSTPDPVPAISIRQSVKPDYLVCLETGRKVKMLKRHLAGLGMTPEQYRAKWRLPADYPMVAPNYSKTRMELAKKMGLGTRRASKRKSR